MPECPVCGLSMPQGQLESHVELHFSVGASDLAASGSMDTVLCSMPGCGQKIGLLELDAHERSHLVKSMPAAGMSGAKRAAEGPPVRPLGPMQWGHQQDGSQEVICVDSPDAPAPRRGPVIHESSRQHPHQRANSPAPSNTLGMVGGGYTSSAPAGSVRGEFGAGEMESDGGGNDGRNDMTGVASIGSDGLAGALYGSHLDGTGHINALHFCTSVDGGSPPMHGSRGGCGGAGQLHNKNSDGGYGGGVNKDGSDGGGWGIPETRGHYNSGSGASATNDDNNGFAGVQMGGFNNSSSVMCTMGCNQWIQLEDLASHELQHQMTEEAASVGPSPKSRLAEEHLFAALQAQYGFRQAVVPRKGRCHNCSEEGHWASDCPNDLTAPANAPQLPTDAAAIVRLQQVERQPGAAGGAHVLQLLKVALEAAEGPNYTAYLCGPVEHFCGQASDRGWGCGWRNIQMLCSHLLQCSPELHATLFGGGGVLPNIPALQAWVETAWAAGFDQAGANSLGGQVQGSRKWIGTTEASALLAYFHAVPCIVDFVGMRGTTMHGAHLSKPGIRTSDGTIVHPGVQCDLCDVCPIRGIRHRSLSHANYDLCGSCVGKLAAEQAKPFEQIGGPPPHNSSKREQSQCSFQLPRRDNSQQQHNGVQDIRDGTCGGPVGPGSADQFDARRSSSNGMGNDIPPGITPAPATATAAATAEAVADALEIHRPLVEWVWRYFSGQHEPTRDMAPPIPRSSLRTLRTLQPRNSLSPHAHARAAVGDGHSMPSGGGSGFPSSSGGNPHASSGGVQPNVKPAVHHESNAPGPHARLGQEKVGMVGSGPGSKVVASGALAAMLHQPKVGGRPGSGSSGSGLHGGGGALSTPEHNLVNPSTGVGTGGRPNESSPARNCGQPNMAGVATSGYDTGVLHAPTSAGNADSTTGITAARSSADPAVSSHAKAGSTGTAGPQPMQLQSSCVRSTGLPPLYFQHEGHSRTIVGIERRTSRGRGGGGRGGGQPAETYTLLVFDPADSTTALAAALRSGKNWQKHVRRGLHTLTHDQYQLLYVRRGLSSDAEMEAMKIMKPAEVVRPGRRATE